RGRIASLAGQTFGKPPELEPRRVHGEHSSPEDWRPLGLSQAGFREGLFQARGGTTRKRAPPLNGFSSNLQTVCFPGTVDQVGAAGSLPRQGLMTRQKRSAAINQRKTASRSSRQLGTRLQGYCAATSVRLEVE